jgi:hypothetical protein
MLRVNPWLTRSRSVPVKLDDLINGINDKDAPAHLSAAVYAGQHLGELPTT